jgi:hypothetical protein
MSGDQVLNEQNALLLTEIQNTKKAISDISENKTKSERIEYYSSQKEVILSYVKKILLILYYIIFTMLVLLLFMKRQQYGLMFIILTLVFFGIFPYIVDFIATNLYYRWLDIMHYFYAGNVAYLYQPKI